MEMVALIVMILIQISGLVLIIVVWIKDCKNYGKENLGVPLEDRICAYTFLIIIPPIVAFIIEIIQKNA